MFFERALLLVLAVSLIVAPRPAGAQQVQQPEEGRRFYPDDPVWEDPDTLDIAPVTPFDLYKDYDFIQNSFGDPGESDGPALNINTLGQVPNSSWFTNRIGRPGMTVADVVRGPDTVDGPAPGVWTVTGRPDAGLTAKFTIRDARGDTYLIKLDHPTYPELNSSTEIISTKIFHAIGYHVPEDYLVNIEPSQLEIEPGATFFFDSGKWLPIRSSDLEHWFRDQPRNPDGTIRALASRYIQGTPVGQFRHYGTRSDDPNDLYPHERRRELRGYKVLSAWLNHDDSRSLNTFDSYIEDNGRRYIRHYLLDFGSNLGSATTSAQEPRAGNESYIEPGQIVKGIATFGLWSRDWMHVRYPAYPAVGNIEAEFFEAPKWKPQYPNPAFNRMDTADAFWAASLVSRFTDEMIRAIVAAGKISDPEAAAYLTEVLITRRDKVVHYWISRTNPFDRFDVQRRADSGLQLTFDNAAVRVGAAPKAPATACGGRPWTNLTGQEEPWGHVELEGAQAGVPQAAWGPADDMGDRYAVATITTLHAEFPHWAQPVVVTLRDRTGDVRVVGIERPSGDPDHRY